MCDPNSTEFFSKLTDGHSPKEVYVSTTLTICQENKNLEPLVAIFPHYTEKIWLQDEANLGRSRGDTGVRRKGTLERELKNINIKNFFWVQRLSRQRKQKQKKKWDYQTKKLPHSKGNH